MRKMLLCSLFSFLFLSACDFLPSTSEAGATSNYFLAHLIVDVEKSLKVVKKNPETIQATRNLSEVFAIKKQTLGVQNVRFNHLRTTIKDGKAVSVFTQVYDGNVASDNLIVTMEAEEGDYWVVVSMHAN